MTDIVERLRHCADNCGDEYLRELSGRAAAEIERLKAELLERDAVWLPEKDAEIERLRAALRYALENGTTAVYGGDDDECGTYSCCGEVSYKPHENDCWTVKARAALKEDGDE